MFDGLPMACVVVKLPITAEDITMGCPGSYRACPIARAMVRHGFRGLDVLERSIIAQGEPFVCDTIIPQRSAKRFMAAFDTHQPVAPQEVELMFHVERDVAGFFEEDA